MSRMRTKKTGQSPQEKASDGALGEKYESEVGRWEGKRGDCGAQSAWKLVGVAHEWCTKSGNREEEGHLPAISRDGSRGISQ